jgi:hypothetical protein
LTVWLRRTILLALGASGCTVDRTDPLPGDTPAACTGCHAEHVADFATARHQRADDSDLFVALRARETPLRQQFCDTCHRPGPALGGTAHGLGCDTCHRATGNRETANARLVVDRDGPLRAARPSGRAPHPSRAHAFVASAELCGTCHEVRGGGAFDEPVFTEWSASPAGRAGVSCADCHMPARSDGVARHDHAFVGPDHPRAGELLGHSTRVVIAAREGETVTVVVHNDNPAHSLPSGARFAREVWVTVEALDARGAVLPASGEAPRVDLRCGGCGLRARWGCGRGCTTAATPRGCARPSGCGRWTKRRTCWPRPSCGRLWWVGYVAIEARLALEKQLEKVKLLVQSVREAIRDLGARFHPVDLARGVYRLATTAVASLGLSAAETAWVWSTLLPTVYLDHVVPRGARKEDRARLRATRDAMVAKVKETDSPWHDWSPATRTRVCAVLEGVVALFVRASSCVEGRNGQLALYHHRVHRIPQDHLRALTVVHNYVIRRRDGTTAAERFAGVPHADLFEHLVAEAQVPARPRIRPRREKTPLLAAA